MTALRRITPRLSLLLLLLVCGCVLLYPFHDYHAAFGQGDNGKDLYASEAALRGRLPYSHYWWPYGPLMVYVYAVFFKLLGIGFASIIAGTLFFKLVAACFLFLALCEIASAWVGFVGALWFLVFQPDFFYTDNHIGGVAAIAAVLWCCLAYSKTRRIAFAFSALLTVFILALIKFNFGLVNLALCIGTVFLTDRLNRQPLTSSKVWFYACALLGVPLAVGVIYWMHLRGLSAHYSLQCLLGLNLNPPKPFSDVFFSFWKIVGSGFSFDNGFGLVFNLVWAVAAALLLAELLRSKGFADEKRSIALTLSILGSFWLANAHEFVRRGIWFCLWWAQPIATVIAFFVIGISLQRLGRTCRVAVWCAILAMASAAWSIRVADANALKTPEHRLPYERANAYLGNERAWFQTVTQATDYLNSHLKPGEQFLAVPYDSVYYFLTKREVPTPLILLASGLEITPDQERLMISDLERRRVNLVLVSNRSISVEPQMGILGKTHCPILWKYLTEKFAVVAEFGDNSLDGHWSWNHAVKILRRSNPL